MPDPELTLNILKQIEAALEIIAFRFTSISSSDDFTNSPQGMEKLDGICMQFMAVGESLKTIDKITNNKLLQRYPAIDWKGVKGFRDIISHHYFDIDADEVYWMCVEELPKLSATIKTIIKDLSVL